MQFRLAVFELFKGFFLLSRKRRYQAVLMLNNIAQHFAVSSPALKTVFVRSDVSVIQILKCCHAHPTPHRKRAARYRSYPTPCRPHYLCCNQRVIDKQHIQPCPFVVYRWTPVPEILCHRRAHHIILCAVVNFFYCYSCHIRTSFAVHNSTTKVCESPEILQKRIRFTAILQVLIFYYLSIAQQDEPLRYFPKYPNQHAQL